MARKISKNIVDMMITLYNKGVPIVDIAEQLDVNKSTVHKYLNKTGTKKVEYFDSIQAGMRLTDKQKQQIVDLYKQGIKVQEIAEQVQTSIDAIYRHINKIGLKRGVPDEVVKEALYLYTIQKLSVAEVLERTGMSQPTFYRKLKKYKEETGG